MFRFDDEFTKEDLSSVTEELDQNYLLEPNDVLLLDVFTNKGERLIDPNLEMMTTQVNPQQQALRDRFQYVIQADGIVTFPMIGDLNLTGMTLYEAELFIAEKFEEFYEDSFVKLRINNRRVFVLGAPGGKVVPLANENTSLVEVLALSEGLDLGAKAQNIKLIREKDVYLVDLSTISGMQRSNMKVEPGDIIYVEPWRRPWLEALRDVSPALSLISSVLTLVVVVQNL
ncbi:MAG: hypothetical protein Tsb0034_10170 [Ekhidna sp.]